MEAILYISYFIFAFIVCWLLIPVIIKFADRNQLYDQPNERKVHTKAIARLGGVGIFIAFAIPSLLILMQVNNLQLQMVFLAGTMMFILGIVDDRLELSAKIKFLIQIIAGIILASSNIRIEGFYGLFGIYDIPVILQYLLTILVLVLITNAFNLIDGIDGLAGGLAFINLLVMGVILILLGQPKFGMLALTMAGAVLGFLIFNFAPAKIFMGDSGSLVIGLIQGALGIIILQNGNIALSSSGINITIIIVGIFMVPSYDLIRVFVGRLLSGKSPFSADKTHIHHLLLATGLNHKKSSVTLYTANILIILSAWLSGGLDILVSLGVMLIIIVLANESINIRKLILLSIRNRNLVEKARSEALENRFLWNDRS